MKKYHEVPYELKNQIYQTVKDFCCVRWKALLIYAGALTRRCRFLPEEVRNDQSERIAYNALNALLSKEDGRLSRAEYGDEQVIIPAGSTKMSFDALYAFEAFSALVEEVSDKDLLPEMCYASECSVYPYQYIFTSGKEDNLYRVLVYGADSFSRIGFLENTYKKDKRYITMLVVPDVYSWEEFTDVTIPGSYRIALVTKGNRKNRTYKCQMTEIMEDSDESKL